MEPDDTYRRQRLLAFGASILVAVGMQAAFTLGQSDPLGRAILSAAAAAATLIVLLLALAVASGKGRDAVASGIGWGVGVALLVGMGWCFAPGL